MYLCRLLLGLLSCHKLSHCKTLLLSSLKYGIPQAKKGRFFLILSGFISFCFNAIQCRLGFYVPSRILSAAHSFVWIDPNRYSSLAPLYYRGASAAVVVYDITNPETFQKAQFWVKVREFTYPDLSGGSHLYGDVHC